jgi:hypothetical protein
MIKAYGIEKISLYLGLLREEVDKEAAFYTAFGITESDFENRLRNTLVTWAHPTEQRPPLTRTMVARRSVPR